MLITLTWMKLLYKIYLMSKLLEPDLAIAPSELEELFNSPAFENDKGHRLVFMDDDQTSMDFVVHVLMTVFEMEAMKAVELMLHVHTHGRAEVFKGSWDECSSKKDAVDLLNAEYDYHLFSLIEKIE